ncbi:UPF0481 protein At3g47200-like [Phoenix dactylifera]|uniref:UPF0481 protein At3g47200-like n=1 Tax=Phoenix dactylifera TaxID=42345 RepID=A0A8B7CJW2_PHODC|nr:UPF0481 protein At3g47200-like [Phoenix dactylifera]
MEEIKWQILGHLWETSKDDVRRSLQIMQDKEAEARSYYSEVINMKSRRFAEMLLLDGYFIIQLFTPCEKMAEELRDLLDNSVYLQSSLHRDLLLLENQLPYFIFNVLLSVLDIQEVSSVAIQRVFIIKLDMKLPGLMVPSEDSKMAHLLDLLHQSIASPNPRVEWVIGLIMETSGPQSLQQSRSRSRCPLSLQFLQRSGSRPPSPVGVPSATELVEAGVKIKVRKEGNFLDISFDKENGLLEIPAIRVQDSTNLIFRNLIALEQFNTDFGMKITCYSIFMDSIIDTEKDVALLRQEGIICCRHVNDKDIALLFNELCKDIIFVASQNYFDLLCMEVNDYCNSRWNRWRARLMRDYFSNPWAILSVIAAAVLLVLTILQTVFSVLSYTRQIHSSDKPHQ